MKNLTLKEKIGECATYAIAGVAACGFVLGFVYIITGHFSHWPAL